MQNSFYSSSLKSTGKIIVSNILEILEKTRKITENEVYLCKTKKKKKKWNSYNKVLKSYWKTYVKPVKGNIHINLKR